MRDNASAVFHIQVPWGAIAPLFLRHIILWVVAGGKKRAKGFPRENGAALQGTSTFLRNTQLFLHGGVRVSLLVEFNAGNYGAESV